MLDQFPVAMINVTRTIENEMRSALPDAPVIAEPTPVGVRPRTYRSRVALATRLARIADVVAPRGWTPSDRAVSSR